MSLNLELLAKALKVSTQITEEDEEKAQKLFENCKFYCSINEAFKEVLAQKILARIEELVNKISDWEVE